jgi:hypothetical protein
VFRRRRWFAVAALAALAQVGHAQIAPQPVQPPDSSTQTAPPAPKPETIEIPLQLPPTETPAAPKAPAAFPEIKFPNFATCSMAELRLTVPELEHLKVAENQTQLAALLDKIGAKTVEIAGKTPDLISHEAVVSEQRDQTTRQNFSFLILQHAMGPNSRVLDEFRVDVATGEKLQTDFSERTPEAEAPPAPPSLLDLKSPLPIVPQSTGPTSRGFVSEWLYFYPANRRQLEFRYLGQEKMDGHQTLVVAFAQKPGLVQLPTVIDYNHKTYPVFMQGVAWVDAYDLRIVRLRSDVLSVPPGLPLRQLTADIRFAQTSIADVASPLWLPIQVVVTANLDGSTLRERHRYSHYRLFRTRSRMVLK